MSLRATSFLQRMSTKITKLENCRRAIMPELQARNTTFALHQVTGLEHELEDWPHSQRRQGYSPGIRGSTKEDAATGCSSRRSSSSRSASSRSSTIHRTTIQRTTIQRTTIQRTTYYKSFIRRSKGGNRRYAETTINRAAKSVTTTLT